jgi:predicted nucleotidyltransferase
MPRFLKTVTPQASIERRVKRIVKRFHPEQIILFGSHARGDARPDSDIDLLVVLAFEGSARDTRLAIREALHDIPVSVDILVTRPEDFAWRKDVVGTIEWPVVGTIEWPAVREGKVVYARS